MNSSANYVFLTLIGIAPCSIFNHSIMVTAFIAPSPQYIMAPPSFWTSTTLSNSPLFSPEKDGTDSQGFDGFNPFQPGSKMPKKGGFGVLSDEERKQQTPSSPGGRISPRQMRMKELITDLLACLSDDEAVSQLLQSNEDFLLEQLNNLDAVLEPDSVYTPDMSREERFRQYRQVIEDRIENARAPASKKALGALKDFVLGRE